MGRGQTSSPLDKALGARIRLLRARAGLSQVQLGEHLRVSFQQVQKYEKGSNHIAPGRLLAIADFLQIPLSALLEDSAAAATGHAFEELLLIARCTAARDLLSAVQRLWDANRGDDIRALAHIAVAMAPAETAARTTRQQAATLHLPVRVADRVTK